MTPQVALRASSSCVYLACEKWLQLSTERQRGITRDCQLLTLLTRKTDISVLTYRPNPCQTNISVRPHIDIFRPTYTSVWFTHLLYSIILILVAQGYSVFLCEARLKGLNSSCVCVCAYVGGCRSH